MFGSWLSRVTAGAVFAFSIALAHADTTAAEAASQLIQSGSAQSGFEYWIGLAGPIGMPPAISTQLAVALANAANESGFVSALAGVGVFGLNVSNSAAFANTLSRDDVEVKNLVASLSGTN